MTTHIKPHAVLVPLPETGHINPLMHLAKYLASHGFVVTFVNTLYNHKRIVQFNRSRLPGDRDLDIRLVGISDELSQDANRDNDVPILFKVVGSIGPMLEKLIEKINAQGPLVTCIISDGLAVNTLGAAKKFGIPRVGFWSSTVATYVSICHAVEGVRRETFPATGIPEPADRICFPGIPSMSGSELGWLVGAKHDMEYNFQLGIRSAEALRESEWFLCNSVYELEGQALELLPERFKSMHCVGPLLPLDFLERTCPRENRISWSLHPEEDECLEWLDGHATASVLYVALGSITILDRQQLEELAYGLEDSQLPILWVLPKGITSEHVALPEGLRERTTERVKIVTWAPQLLVLSHRAIGGFLTHCGWNSTIESMAVGVPMLAWPQQADQHLNAKLVVERLGVAVTMKKSEESLVGRKKVEGQVKALMGDAKEWREVRARVAKVREIIVEATREGGSSYNSLQAFLNWAKALPQKHK